MDAMAEVAAGRPGAPVTDTYEAQVFISGGAVEVLKKSTALEVAPVGGRRGAAGAPTQSPAKQAPRATTP
jgi:hypothetical protein